MVWRGRTGSNYAPVCPADVRWNLLLMKYNGHIKVTVEGPLTKATPKTHDEGVEWLVIKFKLGAFIPDFPVDNLRNGDAILPTVVRLIAKGVMTMRKIIFLIHVTLDGFVAGTKGEMDWIVYNDDLESDAHSLHDSTDAAIYGRVTYQMMESYWPTVLTDPSSTESAREHARWADDATKIVITKTLDHTNWKNTLLIHDHVIEEMQKIKQLPGKNLWLLGSPSVAQLFMKHDLIDEYRINVNPVILGSGIPLFANQEQQVNLKLIRTTTFKGGVVGLRYEPDRQ